MVRRAGIMEAPSATIDPTPIASPVADVSGAWRQLGEQAAQLHEKLQPALDAHAEALAQGDFARGAVHLRTVWNHEDAIYNNAMTQSYLLKTDSDIQDRALQIEQDHPLDVQGFDQAFDAARSSFIDGAPPEFAGHVGALLDQEHAAARSRIGERRRNMAIQQVQQDANSNLEHQEANLSGFSDLNSPEFQQAWARYQATGDALSANPLSGMSPTEWAYRRDNQLSLLTGNAIQTHAFSVYQDGGADAHAAQTAIAELDRARNDPSLTLTASQRDQIFSEGRRQIMQAEQARLAAAREARVALSQYRTEARAEAQDSIEGARARARAFTPLSDQEQQDLARLAVETGSPSIARQANQVILQNRVQTDMHGMSITQMQAHLLQLEQFAAMGGEHADDAATMLNAGRAYLQHVQSGDPLEVASQHLDQPMPALAHGDGLSFAPRIAFAENAASELGARQPTYLTRPERVTLGGVLLGEHGGEQGLAMLRQIVGDAYNAGGADPVGRAQSIIHEIAGSDTPALEAAGNVLLLGGDRSADTARAILRAAQLHRTPGYHPPNIPGVNDTAANTATFNSATAGIRIPPQARSILRQATDYIYEARLADDPSLARDGSRARQVYQQAIHQAFGQTNVHGQAYGGVAPSSTGWFDGSRTATIVPSFIRADQFANIRESLTAADYAAASPSHALPNSGSLADWRSATLVPVAPGRYQMLNHDGALYQVRPGVSYVLDFNSIRASLARRRSDAVLR